MYHLTPCVCYYFVCDINNYSSFIFQINILTMSNLSALNKFNTIFIPPTQPRDTKRETNKKIRFFNNVGAVGDPFELSFNWALFNIWNHTLKIFPRNIKKPLRFLFSAALKGTVAWDGFLPFGHALEGDLGSNFFLVCTKILRDRLDFM